MWIISKSELYRSSMGKVGFTKQFAVGNFKFRKKRATVNFRPESFFKLKNK